MHLAGNDGWDVNECSLRKKALTSEVVTLVSGCLYEALLENNLCPQNSWNSSGWLERSDKRKEIKFYDQQ